MQSLSFTVPGLPRRNLSSNAGTRSRRNPWDVAESRGILKGEAMEAIKAVEYVRFEVPVTAVVKLWHTGKRPKKDECPRCRTLTSDYPSWAIPDPVVGKPLKPLPCCEYRPTDVGNIGGDVLKPILDALVWEEVIENDDWRRLTAVTLRIGRAENLESERIEVTVTVRPVEDV